ncbi:MAG TPA: hypothetical protein VGK03_13300 [Geothrix sp.]|jgi:hypothetical protein
MKPRPTREIRASLLRKGFEESNTHHHYFWLIVDGKRSLVRTRYSNGAKECDGWIQHQMAKDLSLEPKEFDDLIKCPLQHKTLVEILEQRQVIKRS